MRDSVAYTKCMDRTKSCGVHKAIASYQTTAPRLELAVTDGEFTGINRINGMDRIF